MIRVCIVEDLEEVREVLTENISNEPGMYCIGSYPNAESALGNILLKEKPDVVIMDIGLPEMSGIECMRQIKSLHPTIKFLMYTVFDSDDKVFNALKTGADGYILKRSPFKKISEAIREVMVGGAPMSRIIARKVITSFQIQEEPSNSSLEKLSDREYQVIELLASGLPYRAIGDKLNIAEGTVKQHIHNIYGKLQVNNRIKAILLFQKSKKNKKGT